MRPGFANPGRNGRKPGSRNALAQRFIGDVQAIWDEAGEACLRRAIFHDPMKFTQMVAGTLPQRIEHVADTQGMSEERYLELMQSVEAAIEAKKRERGAPPALAAPGDAPIEGGGGPPAVGLRGEVIGLIPAVPTRQPVLSGETGDPGATPVPAPLQTTYSVVEDTEDVDPASLF